MGSKVLTEMRTSDRNLTTMFAKITIGGSGAVTAVDAKGLTVAKNATGVYDVIFRDSATQPDNVYPNKVMDVKVTVQSATAQDLVGQGVAGIAAVSGTGIRGYRFRTNAAAVETDPSSGSVIYFSITIRNSSL